MSQKKNKPTASRIVISMLLFLLIRPAAVLLNMIVQEYYISLMVSMNILSALLIIINWDILEEHMRRVHNSRVDSLIFTGLGILLSAVSVWIGKNLLGSNLLLPPAYVLKGYGYARPGMLTAFSIMQAASIGICAKLSTDRLHVPGKELQVILITALLFGLIMTVEFGTLDISLLARTYLYYLLQIGLISYLYNQTHSLVPGILSMAVVYLVFMLISMH